jgi:hypothetical protein
MALLSAYLGLHIYRPSFSLKEIAPRGKRTMFIPRLQLKGILRNNTNITFVTHKFDENLMAE